MTSLHRICCDPNQTFEDIKSCLDVVPSFRLLRDIQGKIPFQRFLLSRDLPDCDGEDENEDDDRHTITNKTLNGFTINYFN